MGDRPGRPEGAVKEKWEGKAPKKDDLHPTEPKKQARTDRFCEAESEKMEPSAEPKPSRNRAEAEPKPSRNRAEAEPSRNRAAAPNRILYTHFFFVLGLP